MNIKGITTRKSKYSVRETIERLVVFLQDHGARVYARINQQTELERAGITIKPLECLLFGNPKAGGRIMAENPLTALDLPLKIVVWEDENGKTNVAYHEACYIEERYGISPELVHALDLDPMVNQALGNE
jgi:uncharacterized protein (DUF302 family)